MNTLVVIRVTGKILRLIRPATRRSIHEDRGHQPFHHGRDCETTNVFMSKMQAPSEFFDNCRFFYNRDGQGIQKRLKNVVSTADEYVYMVNAWLTIVNYFGLEVRYRKEFVERMRELRVLIPSLAFRRNGEGHGDKLCRFHYNDYTLKEMATMFDAFFMSYGVQ